MTSRKEPKWFDRWREERRIEEEDAYYDSKVPSERMSVYAFIEEAQGPFLADLFNAEAPLAACRRFEDELHGAIDTAHAAGEPWVHLDVQPTWAAHLGQPLDLDPRAAARWLLSNPAYRYLGPPTWGRVVLRDAKAIPDATSPVASEKPAARRRGRRPEKRRRVVEAMGEMARDKTGLDELLAMKQEAMSALFGVNRETCVRALEEFLSTRADARGGRGLSEIQTPINSDTK